MQRKQLPESITVLQSILRAAEQSLEAYSYPNRVMERSLAEFLRERLSIPEGLTWLDDTTYIDDLYEEAKLRQPPSLDFIDYVDWPFSWEDSEDKTRNDLNFVLAVHAYSKRCRLISVRDGPTHHMFELEKATKRLVSAIHAKIAELEGIHLELARKQLTREVPVETSAIATAAAPPPHPGDWIRCSQHDVARADGLPRAYTGYLQIQQDAGKLRYRKSTAKRPGKRPSEVQYLDPAEHNEKRQTIRNLQKKG